MKDFGDHYQQIINTLRTKSAVNPSLIFAAICLAGGVPGAIICKTPLNYMFMGVIALGVLIPAIQIVFFSIFDRDRLQGEEHIENKLLIQAFQPIIGDAKQTIEVSSKAILVGSEGPGGENV